MDPAQLQRLMGQLGGGGGPQQGPATDMPTNDNSETIYISSLALLKVRLLPDILVRRISRETG